MVLKQIYPLPWPPVLGFFLLNHPLKRKKKTTGLEHNTFKMEREQNKWKDYQQFFHASVQYT
jgi:hypothetical protein